MKFFFLVGLIYVIIKFIDIRLSKQESKIELKIDIEPEKEAVFYDKDYKTIEGIKQTKQRIISQENDGISWEIRSNESENKEQYNGNLVEVNRQRKENKKTTTVGKQ